MKTKVLIIEDNYYKFFTTKQLLESQLRVEVEVITVRNGQKLAQSAQELKPDLVMCRPAGGVQELLEKMKKRKTNRRNTTVTLLVATEMDDSLARAIESYLKERGRKSGKSAARAA